MADCGFSKFFYGLGISIERVFFLLIFYYLGHLYAVLLEKKDVFGFTKLMVAVSINGLILGCSTKTITSNIHQMKIAPHYFTALIVAITGIYVYLQLAELLKNKVKENDLLHFIGEHTFSIMMHHQFFFWLFNTFLFSLQKYGVVKLASFDYEQYMRNIYFKVGGHYPVNQWLYLLVGLFGPTACCYLWEYLKKNQLYNRFKMFKNV